MIRRVILGAVVALLSYAGFSALIAHSHGPSWVVQQVACTASGGCLKGMNNPVDCVDDLNPNLTREVAVTADQALRLHVGDPCPTSP